jgi:hypothetical protein
VVAVFVREQDGVDIFEGAADEREALRDLPRTEAGIHQQPASFGFDECAVTGTATAQNRNLHPHAAHSTHLQR